MTPSYDQITRATSLLEDHATYGPYVQAVTMRQSNDDLRVAVVHPDKMVTVYRIDGLGNVLDVDEKEAA